MALFETIKYKVIFKQKNIEVREYDDILLASTKSYLNTRRDSGFNDVFDYISGENDQKQKISMTTPVVSYEEEGTLVTGFYVPSKYNQSNFPKPKTDKVFNKQDMLLREFLHKKNYHIISRRLVLRYQPPFVPGIFRRNEIAYQVKFED